MPRFGKYKFNMTERVGAAANAPTLLVLQQEVSCHVAPTVIAPSAPAEVTNVDSPASAEQIKRVEWLTTKYFAAKDQGRYQEAYLERSIGSTARAQNDIAEQIGFARRENAATPESEPR